MNSILCRSRLNYIVLFTALITYAAVIIASFQYERLSGTPLSTSVLLKNTCGVISAMRSTDIGGRLLIPFHFEARYLWIVNILLLLMGGRVLHELFQGRFFQKGIMKGI